MRLNSILQQYAEEGMYSLFPLAIQNGHHGVATISDGEYGDHE